MERLGAAFWAGAPSTALDILGSHVAGCTGSFPAQELDIEADAHVRQATGDHMLSPLHPGPWPSFGVSPVQRKCLQIWERIGQLQVDDPR